MRGGREILARCLNAFAQTSPCRIFLTSRIIGYNYRPLPVKNEADGPSRELRICAFEWSETEQFITSWFHNDPERGGNMLAELKTKISVWGMAGNPLMATLLCLAYSPNPRRPPLTFPVQRGAVYERVLWGLLGEWRLQRERPEQAQLTDEEKKRCEDKLNLLAHVAWHFFQDGTERFSRTALELAVQTYLSTDDGELFLSGEVMRLSKEQKDGLKLLPEKVRWKRICQEVTTALCRELIEEDGVLAKDSDAEKEAFYGFLHLTFQEYFTACHLAKLVNGGSWETAAIEIEGKESPVKVKGIVDKKSWLPEWQEVIVLLGSKLNDPVPMLKLLSDQNKDDYFRHRLALAALCLPEIPPQIRNLESAIVDPIVTATFSCWWRYSMDDIIIPFPHLTRALPALTYIKGRVDGIPLVEWICQRLDTGEGIPDIGQASAAAEGLCVILSTATPDILNQLPQLLQHENIWIWERAAIAVGRIGSTAATPAILNQLVRLMQHEDKYRRPTAIRIIGNIGEAAATPEILNQLVRLMQHDREVRGEATAALVSLGSAAATSDTLNQLTQLMQHIDEDVRNSAEEAIPRLITPDVRIFEGRRRFFSKQSSRWEVRSVMELSQLGSATDEATRTKG